MKLTTGTWISASAVAMLFALLPAETYGQTVIAGEDFDGGAVNMTAGFDPATENLDGGGGDWFGVASIGNWPQVDDMGKPLGLPFSMLDTSATTFEMDEEGALSDVASDPNNNFFGIADTRKWTDGMPDLTASWTFDISGASALQFSVDLGQQSDGDSFNGIDVGNVLFEYSIDGAPFVTAIACDPFDSTGSSFAYRANDIGVVPPNMFVLQATGPNAIQKLSAEDGSVSDNTILDKCPPDGAAGAGTLDTFVTDIVGTGSSIEIRMSTAISFESAVFDNLQILGTTSGGTVDVSADSANVSAGVEFGGSFGDLAASDNVDYSIVRDNGSVQARVQLELKATSPSATPTALEFTWESSIFARTQVNQTIFLFNYQTNSFEELDTRPAMRFSDQTVVVTPAGDLSRFVEPGTRCMEAQIRYQSLNPRQVFTANMDFANWNITF